MKNLKSKILVFTIFFIVLLCTVSCAKENNTNNEIVASTSWTAAFADLAGADNIEIIAPANLKHPPEYEITVGDVQKVANSKYFIYAGFERMMETLGNVSSDKYPEMIKIHCDNSIKTVKENAILISKILKTEEESNKRVSEYISCIEGGKEKIKKTYKNVPKVFCHKHQVPLAKELGFNIAGVFGPGDVTSAQISDVKNNNYDFIIDNVHNPVGLPLSEVAPSSKYIIWRNFPENVERNSLLHVIENNINLIFK